MTYELLEHEADVGVKGVGATPEEAFAEGAKAMFDVMLDVSKVEPIVSLPIECSAPSMDLLFVEWLNSLLAPIDIQQIVFSKFDVKIEQSEAGCTLTGTAWGETLDTEKHLAEKEVKAATLHGLKYEEKDGEYSVQCVLDV